MVFSSVTFLFLFFPFFLIGYYLVPFRYRSAWILAASWLFYGWWRLDFLLLLVFAAATGWFCGLQIQRARSVRPAGARRWVAVGVAVALGVLAYFKYFNFGVESLSALVQTVRGEGITAWHVVLPIGISFYTFQVISYIVDVYRDDAPVARSFVDVAAYVSLFPQLVAGPIVRYREIALQLRSRSHSWEKAGEGARRFIVGLARKVLIADAVAPLADVVFAEAASGAGSPGMIAAWLGVAAYTIQIYFDFAAYSDMAVGMGLMLGFRFPENFNAPYHARSITEFWRRWHMTLSRWLRDYLYIPLGGSRRGTRRTLVNLMTVMALGGLWHGAAWSFLLWGLWHGGWLVAERLVDRRAERRTDRRTGPSRVSLLANAPAGLPAAFGLTLRRLLTLLIVMAGWVLFRSESLAQAASMATSMTGFAGVRVAPHLLWRFSTGGVVALAVGWIVVVLEPTLIRGGQRSMALGRVALYLVFAFSLVRVLAASYSPFLYFQF